MSNGDTAAVVTALRSIASELAHIRIALQKLARRAHE